MAGNPDRIATGSPPKEVALNQAVIVDAIRSPMAKGKASGALATLHPADLLAQVLTALVDRNGIDPASVDDVLVGCVNQNGEQSATIGRQAWLAAGYPVSVPSVTIERKCGSGQQAIDFAVQGVQAGAYDIAIAAGVESMSRVPMGSARMGADAFGEGVRARFGELVPQGVSAELVAQKWSLSREQLDEFSLESHCRATAVAAEGLTKDEIVPIRLPDGSWVSADETVRPGSTVEALAKLSPAFAKEPYTSRFPDMDWKITAGNSSQITDGTAALLIMNDRVATRLGLRPRARLVASSIVGDDPLLMLTGPIPATHKVLARARLGIESMAAIEVNEAFAPVPLAWQAEFLVDVLRLNPRGGAIALGHPLGGSGCRLMTTLINQLEHVEGRYGLQTMCEAGGMANATIVERLG
jgi:acetyl-CoA acyltransferase